MAPERRRPLMKQDSQSRCGLNMAIGRVSVNGGNEKMPPGGGLDKPPGLT